MMLGGLALLLLFFMSETYAPTILRRKARKRRAETGDERWWCRYDEKKSLWTLLKINLSRPLIMATTEPICMFWNVYIGVVYAILYLCCTFTKTSLLKHLAYRDQSLPILSYSPRSEDGALVLLHSASSERASALSLPFSWSHCSAR